MAGTSSHLRKTLTISEAKVIADRIATAIDKLKNPIHALAMTGISSIGLTIPVSFLTGIPTIYIRKPGEKSHGISLEFSPELLDYNRVKKGITRVGFIDDLISSGGTVNRVRKALEYEELKLSRIFLYESNYWKSNYKRIPITNCAS